MGARCSELLSQHERLAESSGEPSLHLQLVAISAKFVILSVSLAC